MDKTRFCENLMIFGADIDRWPEEIREEALRDLEASREFLSLQRDQLRFEDQLRSVPFDQPDASWAGRISAAALRNRGKERQGLVAAILQGFSDLHLPRPALTAGLLLVIGLAAGFMKPLDTSATEQAKPLLQDLLYDDEGEVL